MGKNKLIEKCWGFLVVFQLTSALTVLGQQADLADPLWGTTEGNVVPGASVPFGMVKLSPDVPGQQGWQVTSGYASGQLLAGFSHTHTSGTGGAPRYGNLLVTALAGEATRTQYLPVKQKTEYAAAGYYQLTWQRKPGDVQAEVTASRRVGFHRYTFYNYQPSATLPATIQLDVSATLSRLNGNNRSTQCTGAQARLVGNRAMAGQASFSGGWGAEAPYTIYFYAEFDQPFERAGSWTADTLLQTATEVQGTQIGLHAGFTVKQREVVQLKLAISYISQEQARQNLQTEIPHWSFEQAREAAWQVWQQYLGVVRVKGGTPEQRRMLYSALRNTLLMPTDVTGENPHWPGTQPHYWDHYCLWDVFRATMPLHTLLYPQRQASVVNSLLQVYHHRGWLPDAWIAGHYAYNQGGTNADVVLADAIVKKLPGIDKQLAWEAVLKNATVQSDSPTLQGRFLQEFNRYGYLTKASYKGAVSRTMEYAYNDFCIAQIAASLGKTAEAQRFRRQSQQVFRLFYPEQGYFWAKDTAGHWEPDFSLHSRLADHWNDPYFYEGGSEVYSYYVPHDMAGLISRHGGSRVFASRLDAFFDSGRFDLSNEPLFLVPYSYHYAGMPHKTAARVRHLLTHAFRPGHQGLPGQDDSGAMSAWFVFSSLGFFPVAGQPLYLIGSPLFQEAELQLAGGKKWVVKAIGNAPDKPYISRATLNGKPLDRAWLTHDEIANGGVLTLYMSAKSGNWGRSELPFSLSGGSQHSLSRK